jgi:hypothetical protein
MSALGMVDPPAELVEPEALAPALAEPADPVELAGAADWAP